MRILSSGKIEIKNNTTGETRIVSPEELSSYNIPMPSNYATLLEQAKQNELNNGAPLPQISGGNTTVDVKESLKKAYIEKLRTNPELSDTIASQYKGLTGEDLLSTSEESLPPVTGDKEVKTTKDPQRDAYWERFRNASTVEEQGKILDELKKYDDLTKVTRTPQDQADVLLTDLENLYFGEPGKEGDQAKGRLGGIWSSAKAKIGMNSKLNRFNNYLMSIRPTLAKAAGDAGNLALQEQIMAGKIIPTTYSTPEEALGQFSDARSRFGLESKNLSDISGPSRNQLQLMTDNFLSSGRNIAKDVGAGLAVRSKDYQSAQKSIEDAQSMVGKLVERAKIEKDPVKKQGLLDLAREQSTKLGDINVGMQPEFSEDVNKSPLERGFSAATEIAVTADLAGLGAKVLLPKIGRIGYKVGKSGISKLPEIVADVKGKVVPPKMSTKNLLLKPRETLGRARDVVAKQYTESGVKIKTDSMLKALKQRIGDIDSDLADKIFKEKSRRMAGKVYNPEQLVRKMTIWNDAYTAAGKTGKPIAAKVYDALKREAGNLMREKAPEVAKLTSKLNLTYQIPKVARSILKWGTIPATIAGSIYGAKRLVGKNE